MIKNKSITNAELNAFQYVEVNGKIYPNDDPKEIAEKFCKTYQIKDEIKKKLIDNISNFKKEYLKNNEEEENEEEVEDDNYTQESELYN